MPRARTGGHEEDFSDPGAEYGIVNDPRKFFFFFFGNSFYHLGPDHVQVFWKHKSIGNQASDWLT